MRLGVQGKNGFCFCDLPHVPLRFKLSSAVAAEFQIYPVGRKRVLRAMTVGKASFMTGVKKTGLFSEDEGLRGDRSGAAWVGGAQNGPSRQLACRVTPGWNGFLRGSTPGSSREQASSNEIGAWPH